VYKRFAIRGKVYIIGFMLIINWKIMEKTQGYSSKEFRKKVKESIIRNGKELENEIMSEKQYMVDNTNMYV